MCVIAMLYCHMNREPISPSLRHRFRRILGSSARNRSMPIALRTNAARRSCRKHFPIVGAELVSARCAPLVFSAFQISNFQSEISPLTAMLPSPGPINGSLTGANGAPFRTASCNSQLQLAPFPRSVDYRGLRSHLSPFRINTSKNFRTFCISLISGHLKSPIINTSTIFDFKLPRINTSRKTGGGGPVATRVATGDARPGNACPPQ